MRGSCMCIPLAQWFLEEVQSLGWFGLEGAQMPPPQPQQQPPPEQQQQQQQRQQGEQQPPELRLVSAT